MRRLAAVLLLIGLPTASDALSGLAGGFGIATAAAQEAQGAPAIPFPLSDRIMAVVGGDLLLESEWREQTLLLAEQLQAAPGTPQFQQIARETYDQMVRDFIIVAAAKRDTTIQVEEERVIEEVDREIDAIRRRFPSEQEFLSQLRESQWGSLAAYRADLQDRKRRELLGQALLEARRDEIRPTTVSDEEVRAFWEENRAAFGQRPETFLFEEIPVTVLPSGAARDSALAEARRVLEELEAGADFAVLARQLSDDAGSREQGGDLGWFRRGRMVARFEEAAFGASVGEIVGPVETPFGHHILQVTDQRADEVRARHILIGFESTVEDREHARGEAGELRDRILTGADVDSLQAIYLPGDSVAAAVVELSQSQLPPSYAKALEGLDSGQAGVVETITGFSVIISRGNAGGEDVTFDEVAPRIRQQIAQERAEAAFVERLREQVYVDLRVRPEEVLSSSG